MQQPFKPGKNKHIKLEKASREASGELGHSGCSKCAHKGQDRSEH